MKQAMLFCMAIAAEGQADDFAGALNAQWEPAADAGGDVEVTVAALVQAAWVFESHGPKADGAALAVGVFEDELSAMGVAREGHVNAVSAGFVEGVGVMGEKDFEIGRPMLERFFHGGANKTCAGGAGVAVVNTSDGDGGITVLEVDGFIHEEVKVGVSEFTYQARAVLQIIVIARDEVDPQRCLKFFECVNDVIQDDMGEIDEVPSDSDHVALELLADIEDTWEMLCCGELTDVEV